MNYHGKFENVELNDMQDIAKNVAKDLKNGDIILLNGEMGSGKTTFASHLINCLSPHEIEVTSPTFNIMQCYDTTINGEKSNLWHLDLYRLKNINEAYELGLEELWCNNVMLIEWAEIIAPIIPQIPVINIYFDFGNSQQNRTITIKKS